MLISELIDDLTNLMDWHGDIEVRDIDLELIKLVEYYNQFGVECIILNTESEHTDD